MLKCTGNFSWTFGGKMLSDHLLFLLLDLHGWLLSSLWWYVQRCWLFNVVLPTEKEENGCWPFYSLFSLKRPSSLFSCLLEMLKDAKPLSSRLPCHACSLVWIQRPLLPLFICYVEKTFRRQFGKNHEKRQSAKNIKNCQGLGKPDRHLGCSKSFRTSFFVLNLSELTGLLAFISKAMSSSLTFLSFPYIPAIVARPLLLFSRK